MNLNTYFKKALKTLSFSASISIALNVYNSSDFVGINDTPILYLLFCRKKLLIIKESPE